MVAREGMRFFVVGFLSAIPISLLIFNLFYLGTEDIKLGVLSIFFVAIIGLIYRGLKENTTKKKLESISKKYKSKLDLLSVVDYKMGLPNRIRLQKKLSELDENSDYALVLLKPVSFKDINNTLGYLNGDELLSHTTEKIKEHLNELSNCVVIGKDKKQRDSYLSLVDGITFAIVFKLDFASENFILNLLRFKSKLSGILSMKGILVDIDFTFGIAYSYQVDQRKSLLQKAQIALLAAKNVTQKWSVYSSDIDPYSTKKLSMVSQLKKAIQNDYLKVFIQPQVDLESGKICGAELILRWWDDHQNYIPPSEFISLAESTGVIRPLTRWIFKKTLTEYAELFNGEIQISFNISARNLLEPDLVVSLIRVVEQAKINPELITLEITETSMIEHSYLVVESINELKQHGFKISVDDFGTGYASLTYLRDLPADEVKIDQSFIKDITVQDENSIIVETSIKLCQDLGIKVIAEGIEDKETFLALKKMGCDIGQGYYFSKPMAIEDFLSWNSSLKLQYTA